MRVACPDCTNPIEASPGEEVVCPACMTRFEAPSSSQMPHRFDVLLPDGTVIPRQSMYALREAIYAGNVPITARVRPDVGSDELMPIYGYPWFAQIYALLGVEPPANAGTRRIAGWQGVRKEGGTKKQVRPPPKKREEQVREIVKGASVQSILIAVIVAFFLLFGLIVLWVAI